MLKKFSYLIESGLVEYWKENYVTSLRHEGILVRIVLICVVSAVSVSVKQIRRRNLLLSSSSTLKTTSSNFRITVPLLVSLL